MRVRTKTATTPLEPADAGTGDIREPTPGDYRAVVDLIGGYRISQAIYVLSELRIADALARGPRGIAHLAETTATRPERLYRVLRLAAGAGLLEEPTPGVFALTPKGATLRSDSDGSLQNLASSVLHPAHWRPWARLKDSLAADWTAFDREHGTSFFEHQESDATLSATFNKAMTGNTRRAGTAICDRYDFAGFERLADIGGGHGLLMSIILQRTPKVAGVVFDRPQVIAGAPALLEAEGVTNRCDAVAGDFFVSVPGGCDGYVLRQILHDWDDAKSLAILRAIRTAAKPGTRLLVIERQLAERHADGMPQLHVDMEMLVNVGGKERTEAEYGMLLDAAGFHLDRVIPLGDAAGYGVFEAVVV